MPEVADLAGGDEVGERGEGLIDVGVGVGAVDLNPTLVARNTPSRRPSVSALPTMTSDSPAE
jgi:hypothetical protein